MTASSKVKDSTNVTLALGDGQSVCKHFQTGFLTAFCCCPIYIGWLNWFFAVLRGDID